MTEVSTSSSTSNVRYEEHENHKAPSVTIGEVGEVFNLTLPRVHRNPRTCIASNLLVPSGLSTVHIYNHGAVANTSQYANTTIRHLASGD